MKNDKKPVLGVIMLDTHFPRIPGDIGNPQTFPEYRVVKKTVQGASSRRVVMESDPALLEPFLRAAEELEQEGCQAITTSCGFLAIFQKEMAARVHVPVFTSSLLQAAQISRLLPQGQEVGILTISADNLGHKHFLGAGIQDVPRVVMGMEGTHFQETILRDRMDLDPDRAREEMVQKARQMLNDHPRVGAFLFECTNMPPYSQAVARSTGLPVYDITTLARTVMSAVCPLSY